MTRPDPATCTAREIYDYVRAHLLRQGVRSKRNDGTCLYRGPEGRSCAVGCLIPDEMYRPEMEGYSVRQLIERGHLPESWGAHLRLLSALQS